MQIYPLILLLLLFLFISSLAGSLTRVICESCFGFTPPTVRSMAVAALSIFAALVMTVAVLAALDTIAPVTFYTDPPDLTHLVLERVPWAACFLLALCLFLAFTAMALARHAGRGQKAKEEARHPRPWLSVIPLGAGLLTLAVFLPPAIAFADPVRLFDALQGQGEWVSGPLAVWFTLLLLAMTSLLPGAWLHGWLLKAPQGRAIGLPAGLVIWGFLWLVPLAMLMVSAITEI